MSTTNIPDQAAMPEVKGGVIAYLMVNGAIKAAEFYRDAFGAEHVYRVEPDDGGRTMHIHLYINGTSVMISDPYPEHGAPLEQFGGLTLQIAPPAGELDMWWRRAVDAGCEVTMPLELMFWGGRYGQLRDPFGVCWAMNGPQE